MNVRRVVTGRTPEGKSVLVSDTDVPPVTLDLLPGAEFHRLWGSDVPVQLPSDGSPPPMPQYFPPLGGFRFGLFTVGPDAVTLSPDLDIPTAFAEIQQKLPGLADVIELDHPGMHTTDTIDYEIVISGEVWLELDDGQEVHLKPGDTVIQNGTRHAWRNKSSRPSVLAVTLVGARASQK